MKNEYPQSPKLLMVSPTDAELASRWKFIAVMAALFAFGGWVATAALTIMWFYR